MCIICVNLSAPYIHFNEQSCNLEHVVPARDNSVEVRCQLQLAVLVLYYLNKYQNVFDQQLHRRTR